MIKKHEIKPVKQQGIALLVTLVMLILLTIIGIYAMSGTNLEEKMSGNTRDHYIAFQAAETALLDAEDFVENLVNTADFTDGGASGLYLATDPEQTPVWQTVDWESNGNLKVVASALNEIFAQPKYIIEYFTEIVSKEDNINLQNYGEGTGAGSVDIFRITAHGTGGAESSQVLLQTTYGKKLQ